MKSMFLSAQITIWLIWVVLKCGIQSRRGNSICWNCIITKTTISNYNFLPNSIKNPLKKQSVLVVFNPAQSFPCFIIQISLLDWYTKYFQEKHKPHFLLIAHVRVITLLSTNFVKTKNAKQLVIQISIYPTQSSCRFQQNMELLYLCNYQCIKFKSEWGMV